jgi:hypothetical protein
MSCDNTFWCTYSVIVVRNTLLCNVWHFNWFSSISHEFPLQELLFMKLHLIVEMLGSMSRLFSVRRATIFLDSTCLSKLRSFKSYVPDLIVEIFLRKFFVFRAQLSSNLNGYEITIQHGLNAQRTDWLIFRFFGPTPFSWLLHYSLDSGPWAAQLSSSVDWLWWARTRGLLAAPLHG